MMQFVKSTVGKDQPTIDSSVVVWCVRTGNYELKDDTPWKFHVLACNVHDAARVAQDVIDLMPEDERSIVLSLEMIGMYGLYAADNVTVESSKRQRDAGE